MGRLLNLYRIQKLYKLLRELKEKNRWNDQKHWKEIVETFLSITEVKEMLSGYKTYIVAILAAAVQALFALGYIDATMRDSLLALLAAGGVTTVAAKINRLQKAVDVNTILTQQSARNAAVAADKAGDAAFNTSPHR